MQCAGFVTRVDWTISHVEHKDILFKPPTLAINKPLDQWNKADIKKFFYKHNKQKIWLYI